jgi:hypothetical protein
VSRSASGTSGSLLSSCVMVSKAKSRVFQDCDSRVPGVSKKLVVVVEG